MPIYEYLCQSCGEPTEALQKMSDAPLLDCPHCGAPALKKKVSAAAFRLKGGGWYETDFKQGSKKNLAGEGGEAAAKSSAGDTAAAPASKTDSGGNAGTATGNSAATAAGKASGSGTGSNPA